MRSRYFLLTLLLFFFFRTYGQIEDIAFRQISPQGGYSFKSVHSIIQDQFGFIWMGTYDGVIRYNSKEIDRFIKDPELMDGLPSNRITGMIVDDANTLWVSTDAGLCIFNRRTQKFENYYYTYEDGVSPDPLIKSIAIDAHGHLLIVDRNYFGLLDQKENQLVRITTGLEDIPHLIYTDVTNRVWLGTMNGSLYSLTPNQKELVKIIDGPGSMVKTIYATPKEVWIGYETHGARSYFIDDAFSLTLGDTFEFGKSPVRKIWKDTRQRVWIATYFGLYLYDGIDLFNFEPETHPGLPHKSIFEIYEDRQGGIWIGTWSGGVAYLHHSDNKFTNFQRTRENQSLSDNMVSSFAETKLGDFYVGTEGGGLNKFNRSTGQFQQVKIQDSNITLNIKAIQVDNRDGLWVGTAFNGLYYRPAQGSEFIHFTKGREDGRHISTNGVFALCSSDSGMWIATTNDGLNFYDFATQRISFKSGELPFSLFRNQAVRSLAIDSRDNLWAGTLWGLYKVHLPSKELNYFTNDAAPNHRTRSAAFYHIAEMTDGTVWIGTSNYGALIFNHQKDSIYPFLANGLLEGKDVYGVIQSAGNDIWITSNEGIIVHNLSEDRSIQFIASDGIQGNLFNPNAIYKDQFGALYFGGTNGFSIFDGKEISINKRPPNPLIGTVATNKREYNPYQTGINEFEVIELAPDENTLRFHFSADNFLLPEKNKFAYRLKNYSDTWIYADNESTASFVNVPAGQYIFQVIAGNNDGVWNNVPVNIPVSIQQYWYKSNLAIMVYVILLLGAIIVFLKIYLGRLKFKEALEIERIQRDHEEILHEMKLNFFTNISHEIRTPLTLINWPVQKLLESTNLTPEQINQLSTVNRNTNRLLKLINQIMDIRKTEKGQNKLNITNFNIVAFTQEIVLNFSEEAKSKHIHLQFNSNENEIFIAADKEKLDVIIYNLLSNAFKYAPIKGDIIVSINKGPYEHNNHFSNQLSFGKIDHEKYVEIGIHDNGSGIDSEDIHKIFNRYEQGKNIKGKDISSGIGLNLCKEFVLMHHGEIIVQSTPNEKTRFSVRFPYSQKAQNILYESHQEVKNIGSWEVSTLPDQESETSQDKKETILIVEDNNELRNFIVDFLKKYYAVLSAKNGREALELVKDQNVHLVVSDVMMPEMDGFELCKEIKSQIETSHIPIILLTALSSQENTSSGLEMGADAYITKPFDEKIFLSQIRNLIQQRKRLQNSYSKKFLSYQPLEVGSLDNYFLNRIHKIIEKNIENEHFSVEMLASEIGLSRSQLHRKLKLISDKTTSEYIMMVRIRKATSLLSTKNFTIDEVSYQTGFNSHSYFTKCFKKIHKKSPKEFLKSI